MKAKGISAKSYRRKLVVELDKAGHKQKEIAAITDLSQGYVSYLLKSYRELGAAALEVKSPPGRPASLSAEQLSELKEILKLEAKASGFPTDGWTLIRIREVVRQNYKLSYSLEHIRRLLKRIGFSRQRPKSKDYRQDKSALQSWQEETLPTLKKSR